MPSNNGRTGKKSLSKLTKMIRKFPFGLVSFQSEGKLVFASPWFWKETGLRVEDVRDLETWIQMSLPLQETSRFNDFLRAESMEGVFFLQKTDGSQIFCSVISDWEGDHLMLLIKPVHQGSIHQIMEDYDGALSVQNQLHTAVIKGIGEGLLIQDPGGMVVEANPQAKALLELEGLDFLEPEKSPTFTDSAQRVFRIHDHPGLKVNSPEDSYQDLLEAQFQNGQIKWFFFSTRMIQSMNPDKPLLVSSFRDETGWKRDRDLLAEQERLNRSVITTLEEGLVLQKAPTGDIIQVNTAAVKLLGMTRDQMMGLTSLDPQWKCIHEDGSDYPGNEHPAMEVLQTGKAVNGKIMGVRHSDGEYRWILINSSPMFDSQGDLTHSVTSFADITENFNARKELEATTREAQAANRAKSDFLANISHEIRTPLNAIIGFSQILEPRLMDPVLQDYAKLIRESGHSLLALINDMLDLSKLDLGRIHLHPDWFNLENLLGEVIGPYSWTAKEKGLEILLEYPTELPRVFQLDPIRLRQIMVNLISNSVKYTDKGSVILRVAVSELPGEPQKSELEMEVEDTGRGIAPEALKNIFDPFYQETGQDKGKNAGSGLGMSLVKNLVDLMGGRVEIQSELTRGTKVKLYFRASKSTDLHQNKDSKALSLGELELRGKLLVVDDVKSNRMVVKGLLKAHSNVEVYEAADGNAALALLEQIPVDLILLDLKMPGLNGWETLEKIRENSALDGIPVYALSASTGVDPDLGSFQGFLEKPISLPDFMKALGRHLGVGGIKNPGQAPIAPQNSGLAPAPPQGLESLEELLIREHQGLSRSGDFSKIQEFALELKALGEGTNWQDLVVLAKDLEEACKGFNIPLIRKIISDLPSWTKKRRKGNRSHG